MAEKNYSINGITDLLILSILNVQDSYVYEIARMIENDSDNLLSISQNTIYTATYKLKSEGKISEYSKLVGKRRTRIYYHIEEAGVSLLDELLHHYHQMVTGVQTVLDALEEKK